MEHNGMEARGSRPGKVKTERGEEGWLRAPARDGRGGRAGTEALPPHRPRRAREKSQGPGPAAAAGAGPGGRWGQHSGAAGTLPPAPGPAPASPPGPAPLLEAAARPRPALTYGLVAQHGVEEANLHFRAPHHHRLLRRHAGLRGGRRRRRGGCNGGSDGRGGPRPGRGQRRLLHSARRAALRLAHRRAAGRSGSCRPGGGGGGREARRGGARRRGEALGGFCAGAGGSWRGLPQVNGVRGPGRRLGSPEGWGVGAGPVEASLASALALRAQGAAAVGHCTGEGSRAPWSPRTARPCHNINLN